MGQNLSHNQLYNINILTYNINILMCPSVFYFFYFPYTKESKATLLVKK